MASVRAEVTGKNAVRFELENVAELSFVPDPVVFDVGQSIAVSIANAVVAEKIIPAGQQLRLSGGRSQWRAELQPARAEALTVYRRFPVAEAGPGRWVHSRKIHFSTSMRWRFSAAAYSGFRMRLEGEFMIICTREWGR